MKKLVRCALADSDISAALNYYIANAPEYALSFIDALEHAYQHIQKIPCDWLSTLRTRIIFA